MTILVGECSAFLASGSDPTGLDGQCMRKIIIDHIQISRRLYNCDHSTSTSTEVITVSTYFRVTGLALSNDEVVT